MAFYFRKTYSPEIERLLCQYYQSLSEKDRRRFAALEAIKLGHGGTRYIAQVLGCDPQTVKDGMRELKRLPDDPAGGRVRKPGGGRKKTEVAHIPPNLVVTPRAFHNMLDLSIRYPHDVSSAPMASDRGMRYGTRRQTDTPQPHAHH